MQNKPTRSIEERLQSLEDSEEDFTKHIQKSVQMEIHLWAQLETLAQFAQEAASRVGVPVEQFQKRMLAAFDWHHAKRLERVEGISQSFAAQIDERTPDAVSTDALPPTIFPPIE